MLNNLGQLRERLPICHFDVGSMFQNSRDQAAHSCATLDIVEIQDRKWARDKEPTIEHDKLNQSESMTQVQTKSVKFSGI